MSKQFDKQNIAEERKMMLERIVEIVKEQLNVSDVAITADTSFEKDLEVDSLDLF